MDLLALWPLWLFLAWTIFALPSAFRFANEGSSQAAIFLKNREVRSYKLPLNTWRLFYASYLLVIGLLFTAYIWLLVSGASESLMELVADAPDSPIVFLVLLLILILPFIFVVSRFAPPLFIAFLKFLQSNAEKTS